MNNINNKNRHERKFVFNGNKKLNLFIALVKSNFFFRNHHPSRQVNSIYFDTPKLDFYTASEEGILPRKKIRIRWYNENTNKVFKETKISSIEGRYKFNSQFLKG